MKNIILILVILVSLFNNNGFSQNNVKWVQGKITFVTKKNIYVKFEKTNNIHEGDSLFLKIDSNYEPVLFIVKKSSVSILCTKLKNINFDKGQDVFAKLYEDEEVSKIVEDKKNTDIDIKTKEPVIVEEKVAELKPKIRGRFTIATNSNIRDYNDNIGNHRFRYIFSMKGDNIINSKFYLDHYISFNQTYNPDLTHSENINDKLRFYRITFGYHNKGYDISLGRQIKSKISALGSFDGIYADKKLKNDFYIGALTGFRPDYTNYGFNSDLFQYGAFISYFPDFKNSSSRGTLAFFEQKNSGQIDRRFVYLQFSTNLSSYISFFGASEIDLYQLKDGVSINSPKLTSLYGNLLFRISRKLNFGLGFDSRKNRIYYETYKDFLETLIDRETRQGLRFRVRYRPFKKVSISIMSNFRFQDSQFSSEYYNASLYFRSIPWMNSNLNISANLINTIYLNSKSLSLRVSKRLFKKANLRLEYKLYQYFYPGTEITRMQNRFGGSLNFYLARKIYFSIYYEKTLQKDRNFSRLNLRATKRF